MVQIQCLVCGKTVELPEFIPTDNYDGQVVCQECDTLLHIKLVESKVRKYRVVENGSKRIARDIAIKLALPDREYPQKEQPDVKELKES